MRTPVGPTLALVNHRCPLMGITNLRFELATELLTQSEPCPATLWARPVHLLNHPFHRRTLSFQLMYPRPHAIHVQAKHLILPHRYLPRVNIAAIVRASFPCSTLVCIRRRHRRPCRLLCCHQRSGDGVPQLKLLEEEHANHRSQREP
ncbi:hypothetical protein V8G54_016553, partial [Vigna mungo]